MLRPSVSRGCSLRNLNLTSYVPKDLFNRQSTRRILVMSPKRFLATDAEILPSKPDLRLLLESGFYVDKTMYIQDLLAKRYALCIARPRKFGKTLFINTLASICRGEKELFRNCHIGNPKNGYEWVKYPVIQLDFSIVEKDTPEKLHYSIENSLEMIAQEYGLEPVGSTLSSKFYFLVRDLSRLGGDWASGVVLLIDQYDSPILYHSKGSPENTQTIKNFFALVKAARDFFKLTFVTGTTKFDLFDCYTGADHLVELTLHGFADGMFGFTREEICNTFSNSINAIASKWTKSKGKTVGHSDVIDVITTHYNGYKFYKDGVKVYNPYSIMHFLVFGEPRDYWFCMNHAETFVHRMFRDSERFQLKGDNLQVKVDKYEFLLVDLQPNTSLWPSMFLSGYLTIQSYDESTGIYVMGFPNKEVQIGFKKLIMLNQARYLNEYYYKERHSILNSLKQMEIGVFMKSINRAFSTIPYYIDTRKKEQYYSNLCMLLSGLEVPIKQVYYQFPHSNQGRCDIVLELDSIVYIIYLKDYYNSQETPQRINRKQFVQPYLDSGRTIVLLEIDSSETTRSIYGWKFEILTDETE